jgi:phosphomevalonate kinase
MKQMGDFSGVPIEPAEQTRLLDICIALPGVVGGGVPGGKQSTFSYDLNSTLRTAGGYDAIWLLVCDPASCKPDQAPLQRVERIWSTYKELNVSPLSSKESLAKGIRLESVDEIPGLVEVLNA